MNSYCCSRCHKALLLIRQQSVNQSVSDLPVLDDTTPNTKCGSIVYFFVFEYFPHIYLFWNLTTFKFKSNSKQKRRWQRDTEIDGRDGLEVHKLFVRTRTEIML